MAASGLASLDFVAAHAAGPRIFDVLEEALTLPPDALEVSREVFTAIGNTSSAAIFFVLQRLIETPAETALQGLGLGLGPGVSIELMHLALIPSKHSRYEAVAPRERIPVARGSIEQHFLGTNSVD
jgi:alkylresorcinol/alkylpyrone synthase